MTTDSPIPWIRAAILCERVLCEVDGSLSAIRITHGGHVGGSTSLVMLLMLVRGDVAPGQSIALLQIQDPTGEFIATKQIVLDLDRGGPEQASSLVIDLTFEPSSIGVYWFRICWGVDQRVLTRVPYTAHLPEEGVHANR